ncbi:hypothetical protein V8C26DRAFT_385741 [Trichoderma gracile]
MQQGTTRSARCLTSCHWCRVSIYPTWRLLQLVSDLCALVGAVLVLVLGLCFLCKLESGWEAGFPGKFERFIQISRLFSPLLLLSTAFPGLLGDSDPIQL